MHSNSYNNSIDSSLSPAKDSLNLAQKLLDFSTDVICLLDRNGIFLTVNKAAQTVWGYTPEALTGTSVFNLVIEKDKEKTKAFFFTIHKEKGNVRFVNCGLHQNGNIVPLGWVLHWDEAEQHIYCIVRDESEKLTQRRQLKLSQQKLLSTHTQLKNILESLGDGFIAMNRNWNIIYWNRKAEAITGKKREDVLGVNVWEVFPDAVNTHVYHNYYKALQDNVPVSFEAFSPILKAWYDITVCPSNEGLSVYFKNISERKKTEDELYRLSLVAKETKNVVVVTDENGNIIWVNAAFTALTEYSPEEVMLKKPGDFLQGPKTDPRMRQYMHDQIEKQLPFHCEIINYTKGGIPYWIEISGQPIFDGKGQLKQFFAIQTNINERKQKDALIKLSEERYRLLFYESPIPMWIYNLDTLMFVEVNEAATKHYGYSRKEFKMMSVLDIRPPGEIEKAKAKIAYLKKARKFRFSGLVLLQKKNGQVAHVELETHGMKLPDGVFIFVMANDITEKVELQKQVVEEKITAQKEMAKAIITAQEKERSEISKELHDNVNQLLTTAKLYVENIKYYPHNQADYIGKSISLLHKSINEIRGLSKALITPTIHDIGFMATLQELVDYYQELKLFKLKYEIDIEEEKIEKGIKLTIYRIVQELMSNTIKYAKATAVRIAIIQKDKTLMLLVKDNGMGYDAESKPKGGLGLQNIKNRADVYKGIVEIKAAPGKGCKTVIVFPLV